MSTETKDLVLRLYEDVFNAGRLDVIDELLSPDFLEHTPPPGCTPDREGARQWVTMLRRAFPDLDIRPEEILVESDRIAARVAGIGTHAEEFMGVPATGKQVRIWGFDMFTLKEGRIAEHWSLIDQGSLMAQLTG